MHFEWVHPPSGREFSYMLALSVMYLPSGRTLRYAYLSLSVLCKGRANFDTTGRLINAIAELVCCELLVMPELFTLSNTFFGHSLL